MDAPPEVVVAEERGVPACVDSADDATRISPDTYSLCPTLTNIAYRSRRPIGLMSTSVHHSTAIF
jgi:hypothetical protein